MIRVCIRLMQAIERNFSPSDNDNNTGNCKSKQALR